MRFTPFKANGVADAPPSKSAAHRALLAAFLAGDSKVAPIAYSKDVTATLNCIRALGAEIEAREDGVYIKRGILPKKAVLEVGESGSTMRFFLPLAAALGVECEFRGKGKLPMRPYRVFAEELMRHGAKFNRTEGMPVTVGGNLKGGEYRLLGNISSQYVTGLLFALPLINERSRIILETPLESKSYVDMTLETLKKAGIHAERQDGNYSVDGNQRYRSENFAVESDYSNAAFFLALGALAGDVTVKGLDPNSAQGDREILNLLLRMGARMILFENRVQVKQSKLRAIRADVSEIPDLAPVLSVLMAAAEGESRIENAARLRLKECDRFQAIVDNLNRAGVAARAEGDDIVIPGGQLKGGALLGQNDHRMVMAAAVMGSIVPVTVTDEEAVEKSFPDFFERYRALGGVAQSEQTE